ncbi:MAG: hypothetical protein M3O31_16780 [Acidobacteriota bacterium]|nr:hypothetical protein [Acidobacteriota bacterium]
MSAARTAHQLRITTVIAVVLLSLARCTWAQTGKPAAYPNHLPYAFSNFVWWTDPDLRAQLRKRIPGLGEELAPTHAAESRVRDALTSLLREKGIAADIISEEPSPSSLTGQYVPEAPGPAISPIRCATIHP